MLTVVAIQILTLGSIITHGEIKLPTAYFALRRGKLSVVQFFYMLFSLSLSLSLFPPSPFLPLSSPPPSPSPCLSLADVESVRLATVLQENAVLKSEMEILRLKCKNLLEENRRLRQASVTIVSRVQCMPSI